jgi:hypothetical protein
MEYKSNLDSTILVTHEKGRKENNVSVVSTSTSTCDEHESKSNTIDYIKLPIYKKMLIHEHYFVHDFEGKGIVHCLTCSTYFCEICGKVLDDTLIHTDRSCFEVYKQKDHF